MAPRGRKAVLAAPFAGIWEDEAGTEMRIEGTTIYGPDGSTVTLDVLEAGSRCSFTMEGEVFEGELGPDGWSLIWNDAEVWLRKETSGEGESAEVVQAVGEEVQRKAEEEAAAIEETERQAEEAERKAKEKLQRYAKKLADRKAKEEAERKAEEEEEAERMAKEEAKRKVKEETKRKAEEEAKNEARKESERMSKKEAERIAKEEAKRKAEEAERKAKEESKPQVETEAARQARASRERIGAVKGGWHMVLGIKSSASVEDVKRSFHELALLHHPDKCPDGGDNGETFKRVQRAYEEGLEKALVTAANAEQAKAKQARESRDVVPQAGTSSCRVPWNAGRVRLRQACDDFEHKLDIGKSDTVPDDIPFIEMWEAAEWLQEGSCVTIDTREPSDKCGSMQVPLPGAVAMPYAKLLKSPETALKEIECLWRSAESGKRLLSYSLHGSPTNGNCAMVCAMLVDVFGFKLDCFSCLESGYLVWRSWEKANPDLTFKIRARYGEA
mmetsp:Transcript_8188/g.17347  ORF Transcript_8188/g.17347 Transcript_8188/m.17347 type:complete len:500 (+) Transcript_8188:122-1621(+)